MTSYRKNKQQNIRVSLATKHNWCIYAEFQTLYHFWLASLTFQETKLYYNPITVNNILKTLTTTVKSVKKACLHKNKITYQTNFLIFTSFSIFNVLKLKNYCTLISSWLLHNGKIIKTIQSDAIRLFYSFPVSFLLLNDHVYCVAQVPSVTENHFWSPIFLPCWAKVFPPHPKEQSQIFQRKRDKNAW